LVYIDKIKIAPKPFFIWGLAALIVMSLIFLASSQQGDESGELSLWVTDITVGTVWRIVGAQGEEMPDGFARVAEFTIRKAAHFAIYFMLAFCVGNAVRALTPKKSTVFWVALIWGSAYGALDEFYQTFIPGRVGIWYDWLINSAGAFVAAVLVVKLLMRKRRDEQAEGAQ